jgi:hypothetical protein
VVALRARTLKRPRHKPDPAETDAPGWMPLSLETIPPVTVNEQGSFRTICRLSIRERESAERSACSLTTEDTGQYSAEGSASGSEMQDSWEPLAQQILAYFQQLERHSTTLDFTVRGVRHAPKNGLSRQSVQPLISAR